MYVNEDLQKVPSRVRSQAKEYTEMHRQVQSVLEEEGQIWFRSNADPWV